MQINEIKLENFRKLKSLNLKLSPKYNLILGQNASGKTSIIEAIYFTAFLNSFRSNNSRDLINFDEKYAQVEIKYETEDSQNTEQTLELNFNNKTKKIFLNKRELFHYKEIFNQINLIVISPSNIDLINSSPKVRRKYLDQAISQIDPKYLDALIKYKKLLKIKNKYLKETQPANIDFTYYNLITEQLMELNQIIVYKRESYLQEIYHLSDEIIKVVTNDNDEISFKYKQENKNADAQEILNIELKYKTAAFGNHLDDFKINLNNLDVKKYGSQGQKRLASIAFFLSQNKMIQDNTKVKPVIVFDDVHLDLDEEKQERLLKYINNENQVIYITTDESKIGFLKDYDPLIFNMDMD